MPIRRNSIANEDATAVRRLKDAGAVILGKLNLTEGVYAEHVAPFGAPVNPWDADRWCGASSSGSAVAVAAGLTFAALSSETGGSIRIPSSVNGVTGLKPTWDASVGTACSNSPEISTISVPSYAAPPTRGRC